MQTIISHPLLPELQGRFILAWLATVGNTANAQFDAFCVTCLCAAECMHSDTDERRSDIHDEEKLLLFKRICVHAAHSKVV